MVVYYINMKEIVVILPDIRSVLNVGSMFRTADAAAIKKIYLCGYTPAPVDRFGRSRADFHKAALGAEKTIDWEHVPDTLTIIKKLREEGFLIVAVEQSEKSISYTQKDFSNTEKIALIFGNEVSGVEFTVLDAVDTVIDLPMLGEKESLNVAVSFGVIVYHLRSLR